MMYVKKKPDIYNINGAGYLHCFGVGGYKDRKLESYNIMYKYHVMTERDRN